MQVERVIIHELNKPVGVTGAKLSKSLSVMDNTNEDVIKLVTELNQSYRRKNEKHGVFDKSEPSVFHECFEAYFGTTTEEEFISFSHRSAENLRERMSVLSSAKGGYLVYAVYEDHGRFCSIFFVRDTTSIAFKRNKTVDNFDLNKVQHIDFEKLAMACRISLNRFGVENMKYLSFIHAKSDKQSQYFVGWISTCNTVTSEADTKQLLKALKKIPIPGGDKKEDAMTRDEIILNTHKIILASPTRTVNIRQVSKTLFDDEDFLPNYLQKEGYTIPGEFKTHSGALKNYIKVYAKADEIELNFYPSAYKNGNVRFDGNDSTQLIIKSQKLVDQVRESIESDWQNRDHIKVIQGSRNS